MKSSIRNDIRGALLTAVLLAVTFLTGSGKPLSASGERPDTVTAREAFVNLPISVLDLLNRTTRLDMLDYWDADSVYNATNAMGGTSRLVELTPDFLEVELTSVSTLQVKLLPVSEKEGGKIIMTVYTVGGDSRADDSDVRFFDSSMKPLDTNRLFKTPELKDFIEIPKGSLTKFREIEEIVPFPTIELKANADNNDLSGTLTVGTYLNMEDAKLVEMFTIPERKWRWEKGKYRLVSL